jgi:hypothetical protein
LCELDDDDDFGKAECMEGISWKSPNYFKPEQEIQIIIK